MEFSAGGNLARKLAGEPLPPREAAELVQTLARAVHHAHGRSVIHLGGNDRAGRLILCSVVLRYARRLTRS